MGLAVLGDRTACCFDRVKARLLREQDHRTAWQKNSALIRPVRMEVNDRRRESQLPASIRDRRYHFREPAAMVEVPVREKNDLDRRQVYAETGGIGLPDVGIGTHVEEQGVLPIAAPPRRQNREAVAGTALAVEHDFARMSGMLSDRRQPRDEVRDLGNL